jgi:hypothetical protein
LRFGYADCFVCELCPRWFARVLARLGTRVAASALVVLGWLASGGTARAYCIATTVDPKVSMCPQPCTKDGIWQHWTQPHLTYILNQRGFPDFTEIELRSALARAFEPWQQVACDGVPLGFWIEQRGGVSPLEIGPKSDEPNDNVIMYFPASDWSEYSNDPSAFALTTTFYRPSSGVIIGADMYFNGGQGPFAICPQTGCIDGSKSDLINVATHEAGHFLGLAHSDVPDSTMYCSADKGEVSKRSLSDDDSAGLCALYGNGNLPGQPVTGIGIVCSVAPARPQARFAVWSLGLVLVWWARRRSRR